MGTKHFPLFSNRKQDAQTIHLPLVAFTRIGGIAVAGTPVAAPAVATSGSVDISAALKTALSTAGRNNQSVPAQPSTGEEVRGVVTDAMVQVYSASGTKIEFNGAEVYGRLTTTGTALANYAFTVSFFYLDGAGTETAATIENQNIALELPYRFDLHELPTDSLIAVKGRNVREELSSSSHIAEELTIATQNTIPDLTDTPKVVGAALWFDYRGFSLTANLTTSLMTTTADKKTVFDSTAAGFNLDVGEIITAFYQKA